MTTDYIPPSIELDPMRWTSSSTSTWPDWMHYKGGITVHGCPMHVTATLAENWEGVACQTVDIFGREWVLFIEPYER